MFKSFLYPAVDILSWNVNLYTDVFLFFFPILSRITLTIWGAVTLICGAFIFGQSTTVAVMELLGKIWPLREPSVNKSELFCSSWGQLWLLSDRQQKLNTEDTHTYTPTAFSSMLSMHWDTASKMVLSKIFFFLCEFIDYNCTVTKKNNFLLLCPWLSESVFLLFVDAVVEHCFYSFYQEGVQTSVTPIIFFFANLDFWLWSILPGP